MHQKTFSYFESCFFINISLECYISIMLILIYFGATLDLNDIPLIFSCGNKNICSSIKIFKEKPCFKEWFSFLEKFFGFLNIIFVILWHDYAFRKEFLCQLTDKNTLFKAS